MLHVSKILPQGHGLAKVLLGRAATVELDWDVRQKSRFECSDSQGRQLGVFLPRGTVVRGGDVLVAEDGSVVRVLAAPQPVMVIRQGERGSAFDLLRAAYHLGNRHVAIELQPDHLKIEPDHVLAEMLRAMHLLVADTFGPFEPEGGAYGGHGAHVHDEHQHLHRPAEPHNHEHEHDTQVHDHEHDSHRHGEHGQSCTR
ncbi:urease accessory protein UreE [Ramlibacter monticola]|uniref:Urease accessory protein UreE n=1 Tax=Ramlibacter monticola TaxID=1926872 RepID=A0A937CU10_9BURK|nr:urease accessory protein UreE [Ramlibacter monticola]MBL0393180.1 urease accessory protein UreE [Ramlibacter monticola]